MDNSSRTFLHEGSAFYLDIHVGYCVYILRMKDGRYYVGMTSDLGRRTAEHGIKSGTRTTKIFGCEEVLYSENHPDRTSAHKREQQIKRWTRAKKEALIHGDMERLRHLSKTRKAPNKRVGL